MDIHESLFRTIEKLHLSGPCDDQHEIDRFEESLDYLLPSDLKEFYRKYKTVTLFTDNQSYLYRFVPISEMHPTRIDIFGVDSDEFAPSTWITICDVMEGNFIAVDIAPRDGDEFNYIDCFHETCGIPGENKIIAKSFTELLQSALHSGDNLFYLKSNFTGYGDALADTQE